MPRASKDGPARPYDVADAIRRAAACRAMRERIGLSVEGLAEAAGVTVRSVTRWESPEGKGSCPDDVLELLESMLDDQARAVGRAIERIRAISDAMPDAELHYYANQRSFEAINPNEAGYYGVANATARAVAQELERMGYGIEWRYAASPSPRMD